MKDNWLNKVNIISGIHTFEVGVEGYDIDKWEQPYTKKKPYPRDGEYVIRINPHRANMNTEGKFKCLYGDGEAVLDVIERAQREQDWSKEWRFRRIDYCFDLSAPYAQTAKLTRLLLLMIARQLNLNNRYWSTDPLTLEEKSLSVHTEAEKAKIKYEVDHYNRSLKKQTEFDTAIINRLEFRMIGDAIIFKTDAAASVKKWFDILDQTLAPKNLQAVEEAQAQAVFDQWQRTGTQCGMKKIGQFIRANSNLVYTRKQLEALFRLDGTQNAREAVKNFMRNNSVELYTLNDLRVYASILRDAYDYDQESI